MEQTPASWHHHVDVRSPFGMMDAFNVVIGAIGEYVMMKSREHHSHSLRQQHNITTDVKGLRQCGYTD
jgi:hypothetical protein